MDNPFLKIAGNTAVSEEPKNPFLKITQPDVDLEIKSYIKENEGYKDSLYMDSKNVPTIGYGFNTTAQHIAKELALSGWKPGAKLDKATADKIFDTAYNTAVSDAQEFADTQWDSLTKNQKKALIDMSYNLGKDKLFEFQKTRNHLLTGNISGVQAEMKNSKWYSQVGNRSKKDIELMGEMTGGGGGDSQTSDNPFLKITEDLIQRPEINMGNAENALPAMDTGYAINEMKRQQAEGTYQQPSDINMKLAGEESLAVEKDRSQPLNLPTYAPPKPTEVYKTEVTKYLDEVAGNARREFNSAMDKASYVTSNYMPAMKMLLRRPDVAFGYTDLKDLTDQEKQDLYNVSRMEGGEYVRSYWGENSLLSDDKKLAQSATAQFFLAELPGLLVDFGVRPDTYAFAYGLEKTLPIVSKAVMGKIANVSPSFYKAIAETDINPRLFKQALARAKGNYAVLKDFTMERFAFQPAKTRALTTFQDAPRMKEAILNKMKFYTNEVSKMGAKEALKKYPDLRQVKKYADQIALMDDAMNKIFKGANIPVDMPNIKTPSITAQIVQYSKKMAKELDTAVKKVVATGEGGFANIPTGEPTPSGKELTPLHQEALKYKTAEEFVKSVESGAFYHGTPSGEFGLQQIHVGTRLAAQEALEARIGIPADGGGWDGTKEYGTTLLAGKKSIRSGRYGKYRESGFNVDVPEDDFFLKDHPELAAKSKFGSGEVIPLKSKPNILTTKIKGRMTNTMVTPLSDMKANATMLGMLKRGNAKSGYYYKNEGEDSGSISAVVPSKEHLDVVPSTSDLTRIFNEAHAQPTAGGRINPADLHAVTQYLDKKGYDLAGLRGISILKNDVSVKDIHGSTVNLKKGENIFEYEVADAKGKQNKYVIKDGRHVIVDKANLQKVEQQGQMAGESMKHGMVQPTGGGQAPKRSVRKGPRSLTRIMRGKVDVSGMGPEEIRRMKEDGLGSIIAPKDARLKMGLDVWYNSLVERGYIPPAPDDYNPSEWVKLKYIEAKGKTLRQLESENGIADKEYNDLLEEKKYYEDKAELEKVLREVSQGVEKEVNSIQSDQVIEIAEDFLLQGQTEEEVASSRPKKIEKVNQDLLAGEGFGKGIKGEVDLPGIDIPVNTITTPKENKVSVIKTPVAQAKDIPLMPEPSAGDPYKNDFIPTDKNIADVMEGVTRNALKTAAKAPDPRKIKIPVWIDGRYAWSNITDITGLPFYQSARKAYDGVGEVAKTHEEFLKDLFKGTDIKPKDLQMDKDMQRRVSYSIMAGNPGEKFNYDGEDFTLTPGEVQLGKNIAAKDAPFAFLVKRQAHRKWMRTGLLPKKATHELMAQGQQIYEAEKAGLTAKGTYDNFIANNDFGVRQHYLPMTHTSGAMATRQNEMVHIGKGYLKSRTHEWEFDADRDLLKSLSGHYERVLLAEYVEPHLDAIADMMEEVGMTSGEQQAIYNDWRINMLKVYRTEPSLKMTQKFMSMFWKARIPQAIVRWSARNKLQPTANALPMVTSLSPKSLAIVSKNLRYLYQNWVNKSLTPDSRTIMQMPDFKEKFDKYVGGLDALRKEFFFMDEGTKIPGVDRVMEVMAEISKVYGWTDISNRFDVLMFTYKNSMTGLLQYRKNPTPKNFQAWMRSSGAYTLSSGETKEIMKLVHEGNDKEASFLLGRFLAQDTNYMYNRSMKGLGEQGPHSQGLLTLFTFPKGTAQLLGQRGFKPILQWAGAYRDYMSGKGQRPNWYQTKRAMSGLMGIIGWYLSAIAVNTLQERVFGIEQGSYGIGTMRWIPGGIFYSTWARFIDSLWKGYGDESGASYKIASSSRELARAVVPFYDIGTKAAGGTKHPYWDPFMELRDEWVKWNKGVDPDEKKRNNYELSMWEFVQKVFLGGSAATKPERLVEAYLDYQVSLHENGPQSNKTLKLREEFENKLRLYPVTPKRKDIPRSIENAVRIMPSLTDYDLGAYMREGDIKKKEKQSSSQENPFFKITGKKKQTSGNPFMAIK